MFSLKSRSKSIIELCYLQLIHPALVDNIKGNTLALMDGHYG